VTLGELSPNDVAMSRTAIAKVIAERKPVLWNDTAADADLARAPSMVASRVRSLMCAPIPKGERLRGVIYVSKRDLPLQFTQDSLDLLSLYAQLVALVLGETEERARWMELATQATEALDTLRKRRIIGSSSALKLLLRQVEKVAETSLAILIHGETGTGKELVARELHERSPRRSRPFIAINCGALPDSLLESELFGHVRGAFTDARTDRLGVLRSAHEGTLFLDEVGEMPLAQQAHLLRVLEEKRVTPIGSEVSHPADFRLVCATHRVLEQLVAEGRFRQDLYYRVAGVTLRLPPLRERGDAALELAAPFLAQQRASLARAELHLSPEAMTAIRQHPWPGNVRELESAIRRAAVLGEQGLITPEALGLPAGSQETVKSLVLVRDEYLKRHVRDMVERFGGNRTAAAKAMGVTPRTVFKYLEEI